MLFRYHHLCDPDSVNVTSLDLPSHPRVKDADPGGLRRDADAGGLHRRRIRTANRRSSSASCKQCTTATRCASQSSSVSKHSLPEDEQSVGPEAVPNQILGKPQRDRILSPTAKQRAGSFHPEFHDGVHTRLGGLWQTRARHKRSGLMMVPVCVARLVNPF